MLARVGKISEARASPAAAAIALPSPCPNLIISPDRQINFHAMADETTSLLPAEAHGIKRPRIVMLIGALYCGTILAALDTTIVTTLMAHIASDLHALDSVSWVATSYTVAYSAFQPIYGKVSDIWGRKKVSMVCISLFTLGCLFCGISKGMPLLVFGRFVSGVGAGGMLSMSTITVSDYAPLRSRGIFQGLGNVSFGSGASLGGLVGGWITSAAGWRAAFLIQVPMGLTCLFVHWMLVHEKPVENHHSSAELTPFQRIDWTGSISLVSSLLLSMLGLTTGGSHFSWLSWQVIGAFALSVVLLALFFYWETHRAIEPVMPIPILMNRTVISACLCNFFGSGLCFAYLYYTPMFLQSEFHYTYTEVGHRIVMNFIGVATGSLGTGLIMRRTGKYYSLIVKSGSLMLVSPTMWLIMPLVGRSVVASPVYQSISYLVNGLGYAGILTITLLAIISAVEPHFQATTTAAQYTFRGAGSSLGIAMAAAVFQNVLGKKLAENVGTDTKLQRKIIKHVSKSLEAIWEQPKKFQPAIVAAYRSAGLSVQVLVLVLAVLGLVAGLCIQEHTLERKPVHPRASTPPGPLEEAA